ncbi:hypothetical protein HanPI659440_Chr13g0495291 [Helianthus annuus]|nr:hypothetical protein HanPI659440_Chr13g0495291 [Helianthus annuus]
MALGPCLDLQVYGAGLEGDGNLHDFSRIFSAVLGSSGQAQMLEAMLKQ